jgi:hypothetical protein
VPDWYGLLVLASESVVCSAILAGIMTVSFSSRKTVIFPCKKNLFFMQQLRKRMYIFGDYSSRCVEPEPEPDSKPE